MACHGLEVTPTDPKGKFRDLEPELGSMCAPPLAVGMVQSAREAWGRVLCNPQLVQQDKQTTAVFLLIFW